MVDIKKATIEELGAILKVYEIARDFMKKSGNPNQWGDADPTKEKIVNHIKNGDLYIGINENNDILFSFALIFGEDPTYKVIENGSWLNNSSYATIHSLASAQKIKNVFGYVLTYSLTRTSHIRIDTHKENKVFQHILDKYKFKKCGVIYLSNGSPRIAYELFID